MSILDALSPLGDVIGKAKEIIGLFVKSPEDQLKAQQMLLDAEAKARSDVLAYETQRVEQGGQSVRAEIASNGVLGRNWRPITMLMFTFIIFYFYFLSPVFGWPSVPLPPDLWGLLKIGLGGYIIGRSAEKIIPNSAWGKAPDVQSVAAEVIKQMGDATTGGGK